MPRPPTSHDEPSGDRYEQLFTALPVGLYRATADGRLLDANPALLDILGYPDRETLARVPPERLYVDPADRARWLADLQAQGVVRGFETRLRRADGAVLWVREDARLVRGLADGTDVYEGTVIDISRPRRLQDTLRQLAQLVPDEQGGYAPALVALAAKVLGARSALIAEVEAGQGPARLLTVAAWHGGRPHRAPEIMLDDSPWQAVLQQDTVWRLDDPGQRHPADPWLSEFAARACAAIALRDAGGRAQGLLAVFGAAPFGAPDEIHDLLNLLGARASRELERQHAQSRLRVQAQALDAAANAIVIVNGRGLIEWVNPAFEHLTGYTREEAVGQKTSLLRSGYHDRKFYKTLWETVLGGNVWHGQMTNRRKNGALYLERQTITPVRDPGGTITHFIAIKEDITAQARDAEALRESEERYALAAQGANDGLWDWNLRNDAFYASPRYAAMLGCTPEALEPGSRAWFGRIHPDDLELVHSAVQAAVRGETPYLVQEHRLRHEDGHYIWVACRGAVVRDEHNVAIRMAGSINDITARKRSEEQMLHDAFYDGLTGMPNRALYLEHLGRVMERAQRVRRYDRRDYFFAVLFIDLDNFKMVNETLGYAAGDQLVIEIAHRLMAAIRPGDTLARIGGDDFAVLLDDVSDLAGALQVVERIQETVARVTTLDQRDVYPTASIGVALAGEREQRAEDVLRDAEAAMYRAKARGGSTHEVFEASIHQRAEKLLGLTGDLRRALERGEFVVYYQPIVAVGDGRPLGYEALVRWQHPERGLVPPVEFIPVAEQTGLIKPMGEIVLREACRQFQEWRTQHPEARDWFVSVNLSVKQFQENLVVDAVKDALWATGLPPEALKLEITESMLMEDPTAAIHRLNRIRDLGVGLSVDDFGTGYSSLSYLNRLPLESLKIDRSFVVAMLNDPDSAEIVRAVITLSHALGLTVVAEGVESVEHLKHLRGVGCDKAQGYHFSKPMPAKDVVGWARRGVAALN